MMHNILSILKKIWKSVKGAEFYIGRDVRMVPNGSILLFPLACDTLACGLAGIVTIKHAKPEHKGDPIELLELYCGRIEEYGIGRLLARSMAVKQYLGGSSLLDDIHP